MPSKKPARKAPAPAEPTHTLPVLAIVADVHIGNHGRFGGALVDGLNRRGRLTLATFRKAVSMARQSGAQCFVVAGDLFHQANPGPKLLHAVQAILEEEADGMGVLLIPGNHDMLDATAAGQNTALAPLSRWATIPTAPTWYTIGPLAVLAVPFQAQVRMDQHLVDVLSKHTEQVDWDPLMTSMPKVLVTHVGVYSAGAGAAWMTQAKDAITAEDLTGAMHEASIANAFVGNYHAPNEWMCPPLGHTIVQVGTLCPHRFDTGDMGPNRGTMYYYAEGRAQRHNVPGPRFVDVPDATSWVPPVLSTGCHWYVRQVGGDPPVTTASIKGWEALVHKPTPFADEVRAGIVPAASEVLTPEEAIRKVASAHPVSQEGWLTADELAGTSIATYKDALK